uniref:Uncharacterized protein n=1 Tax=Mycena chlorophos TaxID=658473 RepID=A0ABQ0LXJ4_MYCCL|nr:predicted protein [Mycena chlorophos]
MATSRYGAECIQDPIKPARPHIYFPLDFYSTRRVSVPGGYLINVGRPKALEFLEAVNASTSLTFAELEVVERRLQRLRSRLYRMPSRTIVPSFRDERTDRYRVGSWLNKRDIESAQRVRRSLIKSLESFEHKIVRGLPLRVERVYTFVGDLPENEQPRYYSQYRYESIA